MIGKFFGSIFNTDVTSKDAFHVSKHLSDYVGMFMRLAFLALIDRLMWAMLESGSFGDPQDPFRIFIIYVTSSVMWVFYVVYIVSIFNLTYRCVVEIFDEITGFSGNNYGIFWLMALMVRLGLGVLIAFYGLFTIMAASVASQNIVKFLGPH